MTGRTGCGAVCGIDDIEALRRASGAASAARRRSRWAAIARALRDLDDRQTLNNETRAVHGAAWADGSGAIQAVREDVGRHNALDKLIGTLLRGRHRSVRWVRAHNQPLLLRDGREGGDIRRPHAGRDLRADLVRHRARAHTSMSR